LVETPGIPRRAGESVEEYGARARRVQNNLANGKASLDRGEFPAALTSFQAVQRDQPGYLLIESLIAETRQRQKNTVANDLRDAQGSEGNGNLKNARIYYLRAYQADPSFTEAREKADAIRDKTRPEALQLLNTARTLRKMSETTGARNTYQKVLDLMIEGDPETDAARKELEELK
jgi:tetratricopeptide (TPR) repeat protein